jgi:hypothetical protein
MMAEAEDPASKYGYVPELAVQRFLALIHLSPLVLRYETYAEGFNRSGRTEIRYHNTHDGVITACLKQIPAEIRLDAEECGLTVREYLECCWTAAEDPLDEKLWTSGRERYKPSLSSKLMAVPRSLSKHAWSIVHYGLLFGFPLALAVLVGHTAYVLCLEDVTNTPLMSLTIAVGDGVGVWIAAQLGMLGLNAL